MIDTILVCERIFLHVNRDEINICDIPQPEDNKVKIYYKYAQDSGLPVLRKYEINLGG